METNREHSDATPPVSTSVASSISEIETTLGVFTESLNGEKPSAASQSLITEAQSNYVATSSAIEKLQVSRDRPKTTRLW